ncbi:coronin 7 [Capsaspora owczarzaki ATCC 30864]|uniref:Coronin n=1 Tax=Capsaspora owczarzaki (strain ATCC 30864) TaxID=595528 RepID=A0A0D2X5A5_CAPO3|nr:coronin 7 [Capsaspora owczarzaki ATCC 30864]KJE97469.1 coronin 7 [Capsaspora owczarzaki ATCC 30864]|eukprot:XP_004343183.1 coronin 7 [Capsaspora owczarzaki ATCC 30864]
MAGRLKVSKFRNALVKPAKRDGWYADIATGAMSSDADHIKASAKHVAFTWDSLGTVAVLPLSKVGKVDRNTCLVRAHSDHITDFAFGPFNDNLLATGSGDASVALWNIPDAGLTESLSTPVVRLAGAAGRIESLTWHPTASGLLASAAGNTVKLWDVEKAAVTIDLASQHPETVQSLSWKADGTVFATSSKDRILRVVDPRSASAVAGVEAHAGTKTIRVAWAGHLDRILTTGFSKSRERQYCVWDARNLAKPLHLQVLDSSTGVLIPMYDEDTNVVVLAGKGDSTLRYLEVSENAPYVTDPQANVNDPPQIGATLVPRRALDVMECEVWRVLKLTKDAVVPVTFEVTRKSKREFQADLFPDTKGTVAGMTAEQWVAGENIAPPTVSLDPSKNSSIKQPTPLYASSSSASSTPASSSPASSSPAPVSLIKPSASASASSSSSSPVVSSAPSPTPAAPYVPSEKATKAQAIVRSSKYRHVQGTLLHKKNNIESISQLSPVTPIESNMFDANKSFMCMPFSGPGGQLAVFPTMVARRVGPSVPTLQNHAAPLDFAFDPFNDARLAVGCEDSNIRIWTIPAGGLTENLTEPTLILKGHENKVTLVKFHPTIRDLLVTVGADFTIRYWDLSVGGAPLKTISDHAEQILTLEFNNDGQTFATLCKDQLLRLFDTRSGSLIRQATAHHGTRSGRVAFLGTSGFLITTGFAKTSARQIKLFRESDLSEITEVDLDVAPAVLVPIYDEDTTLLYVWGRGDSSISTFEFVHDEAPFLHSATPFKSAELQHGLAFLPKATCNVAEVEVARAVKLSKNTVEYISFKIPRTRPEFFQDDLFPESRVRDTPSITLEEWLAGKNPSVKYVSLKPANMTPLSQAPKEQPKESKFVKYNPALQDSPDQRKEKLLHSMVDSLGDKQTGAMYQDTVQGVEESEWDNY